jgi:hypothetical protein
MGVHDTIALRQGDNLQEQAAVNTVQQPAKPKLPAMICEAPSTYQNSCKSHNHLEGAAKLARDSVLDTNMPGEAEAEAEAEAETKRNAKSDRNGENNTTIIVEYRQSVRMQNRVVQESCGDIR